MSAVAVFEDVSFTFGGPMVLEHVNLAIEEREFLGVVGPNGGGKSTLLKLLLGLIEPTSGTVTVLGHEPAQVRRHIGYVAQFATFQRDFPISAEAMVLQGRLGRAPRFAGYRPADREAAHEAMREIGRAHV